MRHCTLDNRNRIETIPLLSYFFFFFAEELFFQSLLFSCKPRVYCGMAILDHEALRRPFNGLLGRSRFIFSL